MRTFEPASRSHLLLATALLLLATDPAAQDRKLNGPLARPIGGDITAFELSADGKRVAYVADQETDGVFELFVTKPGVAGAPVRLAGPSVEGGGVFPYGVWMGPRSRRVVFAGDLLTDGRTELFSVPLSGGPVIRLNAPLEPDGNVWTAPDSIQIDPRETRVVWQAWRITDEGPAVDLFSAPIDGGPTLQLNAAVGSWRRVTSFRIAPDGTRVVYRVQANVGTETVYELQVVQIGGGTPVRLSPAGARVTEEYAFDARGTRVVFVTAPRSQGPAQLHSAYLDGHGPSVPLLTEEVGSIAEIVAIPRSQAVLCRLGGQPTFVSRLAVVPLDGSGEHIVDVLPSGESHSFYRVTPDGRTAVFAVGVVASDGRIARVPIDGSAPATTLDVSLSTRSFELSADGRHVVYAAPSGLRSAAVDGASAPVELAPAYPYALAITPDGRNVVFQGFDGRTYQLGSAPIVGGQPPVVLNGPLPYGGNVEDQGRGSPFRIGARGDVVYLADEREDQRFELFHVPVEGDADPVVLNAEMPLGVVEGDVVYFEVTADGEHTVYLADELVNDRPEVFAARTDGSAARVRLNAALAEDEEITVFRLAPDGLTVVYRLERGLTLEQELHSAPIDGGPPIVLAAGAPYERLTPVLVDPTSTHLVYRRGIGSLASTAEIVRIDGSAPPVVLGIDAVGASPTFSPDGSRLLSLVAVAGTSPTQRRLFSLPIDGSAPGVHLESGGSVTSFFLSADGTRALFVADSITPGQLEAFSAPIDGSAPALRLNPPLPSPHADVKQLQAAGDFAFYLAPELWRVPLDGSATAVKMNGPIVSGGSIRTFQPTPDGAFVVYNADAERDERFELYSVPVSAPASPRKLNPPLGQGTVGGRSSRFLPQAFVLDAQGSRVAFAADPTGYALQQVFVAPVDGATAAVPVAPAEDFNLALAYEFSGDGRSLFVRTTDPYYRLLLASADGLRPPRRISGPSAERPEASWIPGTNRLLYRHDAQTPGVIELFVTIPRRIRLASDAPTSTVVR